MAYMKKGTRTLIKECCASSEEWTSDFENPIAPENYALYAGIYQCDVCDHEIVHPGDCDLPPQNTENRDKDGHRHEWRLLVSLTEPSMESKDIFATR